MLRPGGVLAVWCYDDCEVNAGIDRLRADFSRDVVGPYWPRERRHVEEGYRDLALPIPAARGTRTSRCARTGTSQAMLGYLDTWSAVRRCRVRSGRDPLALTIEPLTAAWGDGRAGCAGRSR